MPWSTWPMIVTTGGRAVRSSSASSQTSGSLVVGGVLDHDLALDLGGDQLDLVVGERLRRGPHLAEAHQDLDDLRHRDAERVRQVLDGDARLDGDRPRRRTRRLLARWPPCRERSRAWRRVASARGAALDDDAPAPASGPPPRGRIGRFGLLGPSAIRLPSVDARELGARGHVRPQRPPEGTPREGPLEAGEAAARVCPPPRNRPPGRQHAIDRREPHSSAAAHCARTRHRSERGTRSRPARVLGCLAAAGLELRPAATSSHPRRTLGGLGLDRCQLPGGERCSTSRPPPRPPSRRPGRSPTRSRPWRRPWALASAWCAGTPQYVEPGSAAFGQRLPFESIAAQRPENSPRRRPRRRRPLGLRLRELGVRLDVDLPARQPRGEAGVEALLADRERELVVRDDDGRLTASRRRCRPRARAPARAPSRRTAPARCSTG